MSWSLKVKDRLTNFSVCEWFVIPAPWVKYVEEVSSWY